MVIILGGGISGLSAAYYALQRLPSSVSSVRLVEASQHLGGWVKSTRTHEGLIFEHGPRTIRPVGENGINTLNLIEQLGLSDKVKPIPRSHPAAKVRMVYAKGGLHALPSSIGALFKTQAPLSRPLAAALFTDLRAPFKKCEDESSYDFIARRLGKDIADYLISPLLCGVCAGDAKQISVKMLFRSLFEAEQKHKSVFIGLAKNAFANKSKSAINLGKLAQRSRLEKWSVYSLSNGLQTLPDVLANKLKSEIEVHENDRCVGINFLKDSVEVKLQSGKILKSQHLISSLPATKLAPLLNEDHPILAKLLSEINFVTVGVVNLQYKGNILEKPAFGFLIPPCEQLPLLGVIYDSVCFPNANGDTILTAMLGGHWYHPQFSNSSPEELARVSEKYISKILGVKSKPIAQNISLQKDCIPQYTVGHYERVDKILDYINVKNLPLHLIGSSYNGIGLNDVIMSGHKAVESICQGVDK